MSPKQKLSVYIKFIHSPNDITYQLDPDLQYVKTIEDQLVYECFFIDGNIEFKIIADTVPAGNALVITKIKINDIDITNGIDRFGSYMTLKNKRKKTHGYMDEAGTYRFRIRHNVMYTQYMTYLLGQVAQ
jgi:hypothetical protein